MDTAEKNNPIVAVHPQTDAATNAWTLTQRKAQALAKSTLIPEVYRDNVPNVLIALDMAERLGASPMLIMQNMHVIGGRPAWSATFLIATVNQCGRFSPLRFETRGTDPRKADFECRAFAEERSTGDRCDGEWITWSMVEGEGWSKKSGSKWRTMPGQMFRYRAAAFWTRVFAPEVSMGILTAEEAADIAPPMSEPDPRPRISSMESLRAKMLGTPETAPEAPQTPEPVQAPAETVSEAPAGAGASEAAIPDDAVCPVCGSINLDLAGEMSEASGCPSCGGGR